MRRNIIVFITAGIVLLLFTILLDHNFSRSYHHTFTKTTGLSKENIEGLYLNDNFNSEKITKKHGKITRFIITDSNDGVAKLE
jgi:hypothetical protein